MSYSDIIVIILSFFSIIIGLFTIWLAIIFYRLYNQFSSVVTEMAKGLEISTIRLERLPKILYNEELVLPKSAASDHPDTKNEEKQRDETVSVTVSPIPTEEKEKSNDKKLAQDSTKKVLLENEII
ncbi:MAG TPA: hypothetical protein PK267_04835 [Atribacterota bacterium]|nr:hypothetical protein [Atribacterota bacterium]